MSEAIDRLARALLDADSRMNTVQARLDMAKAGVPLQAQLQDERSRIKELLSELDEAGEIDLQRISKG